MVFFQHLIVNESKWKCENHPQTVLKTHLFSHKLEDHRHPWLRCGSNGSQLATLANQSTLSKKPSVAKTKISPIRTSKINKLPLWSDPIGSTTFLPPKTGAPPSTTTHQQIAPGWCTYHWRLANHHPPSQYVVSPVDIPTGRDSWNNVVAPASHDDSFFGEEFLKFVTLNQLSGGVTGRGLGVGAACGRPKKGFLSLERIEKDILAAEFSPTLTFPIGITFLQRL